jgi:predicted alpha/beta superfamily hydrolase
VLDANLVFGSVCDSVRIASLARVMFPGINIHGSNIPELIVVGIGYPGDDPLSVARETVLRRIYDYTARTVPEALLQQHCLAVSPEYTFGGAGAFLSMLTGTVRETIERRYRADPEVRVLFGGSAGGHFTAYSLFKAPGAFTHYVIASPATELCGADVYEQEAAYAASHKDLPARVFISFGSDELTGMASISVASSASRLAETLLMRGYPSLRLHTCILQGETHERAVPAALPRGLEVLFGT